MQQMMQRMMEFFQQQQTMQQRNNFEERIRKARQGMIEKLGRFDGHDILEFCQAYEEAMEENGVANIDAIGQFHLIATPQLRGQIKELQEEHMDDTWHNFKVALKDEYFLEDSKRVTRKTFIKWVQQKNKGLTSRELLQEFEKQFDQLSVAEQ